MHSAYDANGNFIGTIVENLTDGPAEECNPKRVPFGKMGQYFPSHAINEFQREIDNNTNVYGLRTVYHKTFGTVEQALILAFDSLNWINCRMTPATMASTS